MMHRSPTWAFQELPEWPMIYSVLRVLRARRVFGRVILHYLNSYEKWSILQRGKKYVCCDVWDCFSVRSWVLVENPLRPGGSSATFLPFLRSLQDHLRAGKIEDGLRQAFSCWRTPLLKTFKNWITCKANKNRVYKMIFLLEIAFLWCQGSISWFLRDPG